MSNVFATENITRFSDPSAYNISVACSHVGLNVQYARPLTLLHPRIMGKGTGADDAPQTPNLNDQPPSDVHQNASNWLNEPAPEAVVVTDDGTVVGLNITQHEIPVCTL